MPSTNIWLLDIATDKGTRIAEQPNSSAPEADYHIVRSRPRWSPDGKQLAWDEITEGVPPGSNPGVPLERLVVYDLASRSGRILSGTPEFAIGVAPAEWGPTGIAIMQGDENNDRHLRVISLAGKTVFDAKLADDEWDWSWITIDGDGAYLVTGKRLFNTRTGKESDSPVSFSVQSPAGASGITFTTTDLSGKRDWNLVLPGKSPQPIGQLHNIVAAWAIAPDGIQAAFLKNDDKDVWIEVVSIHGIKTTIHPDCEPLTLSWGPLTMEGKRR